MVVGGASLNLTPFFLVIIWFTPTTTDSFNERITGGGSRAAGTTGAVDDGIDKGTDAIEGDHSRCGTTGGLILVFPGKGDTVTQRVIPQEKLKCRLDSLPCHCRDVCSQTLIPQEVEVSSRWR